MSSKYSVKHLPEVEQEVEDIFDYLTETLCSPSAAKKLSDEINKALSYLKDNPIPNVCYRRNT